MSILASATTHRDLVHNLVVRDIKTRYKQSFLGYAWAFLNPLIWALIYALVGGILMRQTLQGANGQAGLPYVIHSYFGILLWNLFSTGLGSATEGLVSHISLITKIYFPREVFPVSAVLSKVVDYGFGLIGLIPLLLFYRAIPSGTIVFIIPLIVLTLLWTTGLGMLCACANLFYRDIRYLVQLALALGTFVVPNMYGLDRVTSANLKHPGLYPFYMLNPMAVFIEASRRFAFPQSGSPWELWPYLISAAALSAMVFFVGFVVFKRYEPRFAESI